MERDREQEPIGQPPENAEETDPRVVRGRARYVRNNAARMKHPEYRKAGLPGTRSWVESLSGEINYRVQGTETFWNEDRAETARPGPADVLSDDGPLDKHIATRPGSPFQRPTAA